MAFVQYGGCVGVLSDFQLLPITISVGIIQIGFQGLFGLDKFLRVDAINLGPSASAAPAPFGIRVSYGGVSLPTHTATFPIMLTGNLSANGLHYYPSPFQTVEIAFLMPILNQTSGVYTPGSGSFELRVNGVSIVSVSGISRTLGAGPAWNDVAWQWFGYGNAMYVRQTATFCPGFGQSFSTPGDSGGVHPIPPSPVATVCAAGPDTLHADNFTDAVASAVFADQGGYWTQFTVNGEQTCQNRMIRSVTSANALDRNDFAPANLIPAGTGSITVKKVTTPADPAGVTAFAFTAGGGLSPASFTLTDGQSQVFSALPAGSFSIAETPPPVPWMALPPIVSNGSPASALTVANGEAVTVTFRNLGRFGCTADLPPSAASGGAGCGSDLASPFVVS